MEGTGIFVTKEELEWVKQEQAISGMFLPGGKPMGDPAKVVNDLVKKHNPPNGSGLNIKTGEFVV